LNSDDVSDARFKVGSKARLRGEKIPEKKKKKKTRRKVLLALLKAQREKTSSCATFRILDQRGKSGRTQQKRNPKRNETGQGNRWEEIQILGWEGGSGQMDQSGTAGRE